MTADQQYIGTSFAPQEIEHRYGQNVHILKDPFALSHLARLCTEECKQPLFNRIIKRLYTRLLTAAVNTEFPRVRRDFETRMSTTTDRAVFSGEVVDRTTKIVTVDIARAGILPSQVCYDHLNELMEPDAVRQDHLIMSRVTNPQDEVVGAKVSGDKIGGPIDGRMVLFPDPMGATGSSMSTAISYYKEAHGGSPLRLVTLTLICTPEFIRRMREDHPEAVLYSLRLDRGMSPDDVLNTVPGTRWDEESGLNEQDYIIPGGGGFGELMNNAWV
jgi:uracil phosphoribosyltransferase